MKVSKKGVALIKHFESCSLEPYKCSAGKDTIGWGHVIKSNEQSLFQGITDEEADELLEKDLLSAESDVEILVTNPLKQNEFDALVSFVFNLGRANFASSTLLRQINQGLGSHAIENQLLRWIYTSNPETGIKEKSKGLLRRRMAEAHMYRHNRLQFNFPDVLYNYYLKG